MNAALRDRRSVLKLSRVYNATRSEIFAAWTDPEQVRQWMCPGDATVALVTIDLRIEGTFRIDMRHEGSSIVHTGTYREIKPPEKIVFTWISENTSHRETLVTVELFELGTQTELVLTHEFLPDENAFQAHASGWTSILKKLAWHIED